MYTVYWIIDNINKKTYVGFTDNLESRLKQHKNREVKTTQNFIFKKAYILESEIETIQQARNREKYWKSSAGRKKLKTYFNKLI